MREPLPREKPKNAPNTPPKEMGEGIWMQKGRSQCERCIEYTEC